MTNRMNHTNCTHAATAAGRKACRIAFRAAVANFNTMQAARGDNAGCNPEWRAAASVARTSVLDFASTSGMTRAKARNMVEAAGLPIA